MKLALVLSPLVAFAGYVLVRALRGRPLSRFTLNIGVALFLLVYLLVTAALGVFWVARMDLPAFDWHYLFGYCVVLLAIVHIAFQLRILGSFLRRISPSALLLPNGSAFRPGVRIAAGIAGALVLLSPFVWLTLVAVRGGAPARVRLAARSSEPAAAQTAADSAQLGPRDAIWIEREDGRVSALDYLHEQSSYSRGGLLRSVGVAPARPPDVKEYAGAKQAPLPKPRVRANVSFDDALRGERAGGHRIVTSENAAKASLLELSELAYYAAGVTSPVAESGGILLRAAASSGALYPVDLYAITDEANGSGRQVHYYDPRRHTLVAMNAPVEHLGAGLARPEGIGDAAATFVLAVTFDRTVQKYNVRSYRYVALDAGHVAANLVLAGTALGFTCRLLSLFDDAAVTSALALDSDAEAALLVVPCARGRTRSSGASSQERALERPLLPERADEWELTRLSHRLTSVKLSTMPRELPPPSRAEPVAQGFALPHAPPLQRDLFETIAARRSYRDFSDEPLSLSELAGVLRAAAARPALRGLPLAGLHVLVRRVEGLEQGAYRYEAASGHLIAGMRGDRARELEGAGLSQEVLGRASAVLVWTLADGVGSTDGARDYRTAQLEAGFGGELAYLAASALGLGLCGVGAFYDDEVNELLVHGERRPRAVYLQALGRR